jgi:hypothetical protein
MEVEMKMVKSLLLGTAAGVVAVVGAQAADMPVKAKPVEYVKVCSLYGDGFYYMPGTNTCIKIGGFVRAEANYHAATSFATSGFWFGANAQFFRGGDEWATRARGVVTIDVRENTEYGVLRSYMAIGAQFDTNSNPTISLPGTAVPTGGGAAAPAAANNNLYFLRAFIQYAGFTIGKTTSVFDFFNTTRYSNQTVFLHRDASAIGINAFGYTQDLGNGFSVSGALEDDTPISHPIHDLGAPGPGTLAGPFAGNLFPIIGSGPTNSAWDNAGLVAPDLTFDARVSQTWGAAQIMFGLHDNRARYYTGGAGNINNGPAVNGLAYPEDKWGWAAGAGIEMNLPWSKGDSFAIQTQYCVGWVGRCHSNNANFRSDLSFALVNADNPSRIGLAWSDDAFLANTAATGATQLQLTTYWNVYAAIQHFWVPWLRTSLYGGYGEYRANSQAVDTLVCTQINTGTGRPFGPGCADWAAFQIGSRTLWNPTKNLDISGELQYSELTRSAFNGAVITFSPTGHAPSTFVAGSTNVLSAIIRFQRNFYP